MEWGGVIVFSGKYYEPLLSPFLFPLFFLFKDNVDVRVARIFNTYGPRMHMFDGKFQEISFHEQ